MTNKNHGRLTVNLDGNWRLYTNTIPVGSTPLGVVTRDDSDTGALVRIDATGVYVQVNAGEIRSLDGRKVAAALGITGRPAEMESGKRVNVYLDTRSLSRASQLGNGNVSEGIRTALKTNQESDQMETYAAVQHAPQKISIDKLINGKYVCQVSFWFSGRGDAKAELERLCAADGVAMFSEYVVAPAEVGL